MRYLTTLLFLLATSMAGADSAITYQGQLQDAGGPVDDTVDMSFALFENEIGGDPVGGPIALPGVSVVDGLFQVDLDFGDQDYASGLWLAIEVAGEPLAPRQAITGAPFAISVAPGSGSNWERSGPHIHYVDGRVGIGTSLPSVGLDVVGSAKFGGSSNEASGGNSFVGGGLSNQATGERGFVGGGHGNIAAGLNSFVAGSGSIAEGRGSHAAGRLAHALHEGSFVWSHWNLGDAEFASTGVNQFLIRAEGGVGIGTSSPSAQLDVVGSAQFGDSSNAASGVDSFVGGGLNNQATGERGFVGGGAGNIAAGLNSFVAGSGNIAEGRGSHAAGRLAHALHEGSFVWSHWNLNDAEFVSTGVNQFLIRAEGGVGIGTNSPSAALDVVGSGKFGHSTSEAIGANSFVTGGSSGFPNQAEGLRSFVGGGRTNTAGGFDSFVGGGRTNTASGLMGFVGGGSQNIADGTNSFVAGGLGNTASGNDSFVAGGSNNIASGNYSFAGGRNAHALHDGNFIWADSLPHMFDYINALNFFAVRATGGTLFVSGVDSDGGVASGAMLFPGASSWVSMSDRNAKMAITEVDPGQVLENLMQMSISEYSYKSQDESIRHMGPMAQDFHPLFGLGEDELMISAMNLAGIALAAIQGLNTELDSSVNRVSVLEADRTELAKRVAALEADNAELRQLAKRNNALEARLAALEALLVEDRQVAGQPQ